MVFDPANLFPSGDQLSARALDALAEQAAIPQASRTGSNFYQVLTPQGETLIPQPQPDQIFRALLSAVVQVGSVWTYSWAEQVLNPSTNAYVPLPGGRSGTATVAPAYELNNNQVSVPTLVWMIQRGVVNGAAVYEFDRFLSGGSSLTLEDVSLTPIYTPVMIVQTDVTNGIGLSQPDPITAPGTVLVSLIPCTGTQQGVVSLANQTMGAGDKTFQGAVIVGHYASVAWYVDIVGAAGVENGTTLRLQNGNIEVDNGKMFMEFDGNASPPYIYFGCTPATLETVGGYGYVSTATLGAIDNTHAIQAELTVNTNAVGSPFVNLISSGGGGQPYYAVNGSQGVTGSSGGFSFVGGICTAIPP